MIIAIDWNKAFEQATKDMHKVATGAVAPSEWSGEGLPPVGAEIEFNDPEGDYPKEWFRGKVEYCSSVTAVVSHESFESGQIESCFYPNTVRFRPIRTAEQIAAEQSQSEINDIHRLLAKKSVELAVTATREDFSCLAETLYKAGYRKQVAP